MLSAPLPPDEAERLYALRSLDLLDTPREERFERITRLASRLFGLPSATISLIDAERVLKRVKGVAFTRFTSADVVRHPLVARIVDAYDAQGSAARRRAHPED